MPFLFSCLKSSWEGYLRNCSCKTSWESQNILSLSDYTLYSCRWAGRERVPLAETQGKYTSDALHFLWSLQTKLRAYLKIIFKNRQNEHSYFPKKKCAQDTGA